MIRSEAMRDIELVIADELERCGLTELDDANRLSDESIENIMSEIDTEYAVECLYPSVIKLVQSIQSGTVIKAIEQFKAELMDHVRSRVHAYLPEATQHIRDAADARNIEWQSETQQRYLNITLNALFGRNDGTIH